MLHRSLPTRRRLASLAGFAACTLAGGCGSRTELLFAAASSGGLADASVTNDGSAPDDASTRDAAPLPCTPGTFPLTTAVPAIMLVLDRSGSMNDPFANGQSRWTTLANGLSATLPPVDASMEIGALLFPSVGSSSGGGSLTCELPSTVELTPATGNVPALVSLLQSTSPGGGTPTFGALALAATTLLGIRAATTARAMVLATDGAPNCDPDLDPTTCTCAATGQSCNRDVLECLDNVRTVQSIGAYAAQGLPTYVVGIQSAVDSEFAQILNAMALAGGRPQLGASTSYYEASSAADLDSALVTIRNQVGACTFLTTSVPGNEGSITVTLNGVILTYDPTGKTGWSWGDEANGQIVLAGSACTAAVGGSAVIVARVGCGVGDAAADGP